MSEPGVLLVALVAVLAVGLFASALVYGLLQRREDARAEAARIGVVKRVDEDEGGLVVEVALDPKAAEIVAEFERLQAQRLARSVDQHPAKGGRT